MIAMVRAAVGAILRPDVHGLGMLGMCGDRPDRRRFGKTARDQFRSVAVDFHAIEPGFDGAVRGGLTCQAYIDMGRAIRRHGAHLRDPGSHSTGERWIAPLTAYVEKI